MKDMYLDRYEAMLLCANGRKIDTYSSERVKKAAEKQLNIAKSALISAGMYEKAAKLSLNDFREYPSPEQAIDFMESNGLEDFIGEIRPADA